MFIVLRTHFNTGKSSISRIYLNRTYAYDYAQKKNRYSCKNIYRVIEIDLLSILKNEGLI